MKIKTLTFLSIFLACNTTIGAESFDEDVLLALVKQVTGGTLSTGLPSGFPEFDLPEELSLLGSLDVNYNQTVAYTVEGNGEVAGQDLASNILRDGWIQLLSYNIEQPTNGFINPNAEPLRIGNDQQYCHDDFGTLLINSPEDDLVLVSMFRQSLMQPGFSCQQQNIQRQQQNTRQNQGFPYGLQNTMFAPRLEVPVEDDEDVFVPPIRPMMGFSGSDDDFRTQTSVSTGLSMREIKNHFATQLESQGWNIDSEWDGELSSGGNWHFSTGQGQEFMGTLTIFARGDDRYDLQFRMMLLGSGGGASIQQGFFTNG